MKKILGCWVIIGLVLTSSCSPVPTDIDIPKSTQTTLPKRIVSLDYCADQYVLKLANKSQILAISPDATKDFSYMREGAIGVPNVRPVAEDIIILEPDLVVRSYGGGPHISSLLEQAGIPVLQVGWSSNIDSEEVNSIPALIDHIAQGLGHAERGQELITEFRDRLNAIKFSPDTKSALYMTPGGVTSGEGSLVHEMLLSAGLTNFHNKAGWHPLPIERLVYEQPDIIAAAFSEAYDKPSNIWSVAKHPIARQELSRGDVVELKSAWTSCGGWFILDGIEALAKKGTQ